MTTPTDDQIDDLWDEIGEYFNLYPEVRNTVREALNRWGTPKPIPLEDRTPQQIDLNNDLIHTETSYQMDVKQSRVVTITLNEDDLIEIRKLLSEIDELWNSSGEELREYYSSTAIGKLWSIL